MAPGISTAAATLSSRVWDHFVRHAEAATAADGPLAPVPGVDTIEAIVHAAFWASLRREEGYIPKISLAYLPPSQATRPLTFAEGLPLAPDVLGRIAPAVERPGIHLGVWREGSDLRVWGTTRAVPRLGFVLEVASPGLLVIKHRRGEEPTKFANVAVLAGDEIKIIDEAASSLPDCPPLLTSLLGFDAPATWGDTVNVLVQLAVSMRGHGRGGALLVVPAESETWRESILEPIRYAVAPPFTALVDLMHAPADARHDAWHRKLARTVDAVAGLTAVDGATILTNRYGLLAFGAKIVRRDGTPQVERVMVTEPIEGGAAAVLHPTQLGGTRHLSAAQFVQDQPDAVALVASQDGRFTVFAWSPCEGMVHAHRVEVLLL